MILGHPGWQLRGRSGAVNSRSRFAHQELQGEVGRGSRSRNWARVEELTVKRKPYFQFQFSIDPWYGNFNSVPKQEL